MKRKITISFLVMLFFILLGGFVSYAQETVLQEQDEIYEKSGAKGMYESLDKETRDRLSEAGIDIPQIKGELRFQQIFNAISAAFRDKITAPMGAVAALSAIIIICRICTCFENDGIGNIAIIIGTLIAVSVLVMPIIKLISSVEIVIKTASVFLATSVPIYSALMIASGDTVTGGGYGLLTLAAANAVPMIAGSLIIPLLNIFLAFAISSAISDTKFQKLTDSLYRFSKWVLILLVTIFCGFLTIQTILNTHVDSVTKRTAKLFASTAIPIVGGAFGDALSAIGESVQLVKSGVGAFGVLAALFIFLPIIIEILLWIFVCNISEIVSDLFEVPQISSFMGVCSSVVKMILAVVVSVMAVCVASAAVVLVIKN